MNNRFALKLNRFAILIFLTFIIPIHLHAQWSDPIQRNITNDLTHGQRAIPTDIDEDGDIDIIASYSLADAVSILINTNGDGSNWQRIEVGSNIVAMYAMPLDADGDLLAVSTTVTSMAT